VRSRLSCDCRADAKHRDEAGHSAGRGQVLQRVAADQLARRFEDWCIGQLQPLRGGIRREAEGDVRRVAATTGVEPQNQDHQRQRPELHDEIRPQISRVMQLGPVPVDDTRRARGEQRDEQGTRRLAAHAFGQERREQPHEADRHRQAIPEQSCIVGCEVEVRGADARHRDTREERAIRPRVPVVRQHPGPAPAGDGDEPGDADNRERNIRQDVEAVRHTEKRPVVGEDDVFRRLRDGRPPEGKSDSRECRAPEDRVFPDHASLNGDGRPKVRSHT
jgi:hypothetical protein